MGWFAHSDYISHLFLSRQMRGGIPVFITIISKRGNYSTAWKMWPFLTEENKDINYMKYNFQRCITGGNFGLL